MQSSVWTIEADLEAAQLLYLTGDPVALGFWEPNMAMQMSPMEHANLWMAEDDTSRRVCCVGYEFFFSLGFNLRSCICFVSRSCLSKACCPWLHARDTPKPLPCTTSLAF